MRTPLRSLVSAILALLLLATLTAPLSSRVVDEEAQVVSMSEQLETVASNLGTASYSDEKLQSDRSSAFGSFIRPLLAETVVAERGFDETDFTFPSTPHTTRPAPVEPPDIGSPTQESTTRRALLSVYRL